MLASMKAVMNKRSALADSDNPWKTVRRSVNSRGDQSQGGFILIMDKVRLSVTSKDGTRRRSLSKSSKYKDYEIRDDIGTPTEVVRPPDYHNITCIEDWTRNMYCAQVFYKAAILYEQLNKVKLDKEDTLPTFFNEFERKRAYAMAFATKRHTPVLKEVLTDSSFANSYYELLELHEATVLVLLMDIYDHKFSGIHLKRKCDFFDDHFVEYIDDITNTIYKSRIKLCAAFARQRIEFCAPSLEEMLPEEEKEKRRNASQHPVYVRVNTLLTEHKKVLETLESNGFEFVNNLPKECDEAKQYCSRDENYQDLLMFPNHIKDDIYCMDLAMQFHIIPQSKPRYVVAELVRKCMDDLVSQQQQQQQPASQSLSELLSNTKLEPVVSNEIIDHVLLTHPESGSLSSHICSYLDKNKKLLICGGNTRNGEQMQHMLRKVGAINYAFLSESFTDISPTNEFLKFCKIVICNPPCSKSGVVNLVDFILYEGLTAGIPLSKTAMTSKLPELTQNQTATLNHAIRLPGVQQIVYCTYSSNSSENEGVIDRVLRKENVQYEVSPILSDIVPNLHSPGLNMKKGFHISLPPSEKMDGFFVTLLKRKKEHLHAKLNNVLKKKSPSSNLEKKKSKTKKKKAKGASNSTSKESMTSVKSTKKDAVKKSSSKKLISKKSSKGTVKKSKKKSPRAPSELPMSDTPVSATPTLLQESTCGTPEIVLRPVGDRFKFGV